MLFAILNKIKGYMVRITIKNKKTIMTNYILFNMLVEVL